MGNTIITISRQFGSGGRAIGMAVAEKLGIPFYNKEIIDQAAEKLGFSKEFVKKNEQRMKISSTFAFGAPTMGGPFANVENVETKIFNMEVKVLEEIASQGPCVIVGRCSDYILKGKFNCLNIFCHASLSDRIKRIMEVYKLVDDKDKALKMVKDADKLRGRHYKYFTDQVWGDANNYDLSINAGKLGIEKAADIIVGAYKELDK